MPENAKGTNHKENDGEQSVKLNPQQLGQLMESERQRLDALGQRGQMVENALLEVQGTKQLLEEFKKGKASTIMVPLGAGFYSSVERKEEKLLKSLAGNVLMPSTIDQAITDLQEREKKIKIDLEQLAKEQQMTVNNLNQLQQVAMAMNQKMQEASAAKNAPKGSSGN